MDLKALAALLEPVLQQYFDNSVFPAISNEIAKISDPILKQAVLDFMPSIKSAVDDSLKALVAKI